MGPVGPPVHTAWGLIQTKECIVTGSESCTLPSLNISPKSVSYIPLLLALKIDWHQQSQSKLATLGSHLSKCFTAIRQCSFINWALNFMVIFLLFTEPITRSLWFKSTWCIVSNVDNDSSTSSIKLHKKYERKLFELCGRSKEMARPKKLFDSNFFPFLLYLALFACSQYSVLIYIWFFQGIFRIRTTPYKRIYSPYT